LRHARERRSFFGFINFLEKAGVGPMQGLPPEPWQRRIKYLELAAEAIRAAAQSNTPDMRKAYLSIANSWMEMARETEPKRD